jgi:hypothetical protein
VADPLRELGEAGGAGGDFRIFVITESRLTDGMRSAASDAEQE